jgi:mRNA interferase RelE/StbE
MDDYYFTSQALRQIKNLPKNIQKRIIKKLDFFCQKDPLKYADFLTDSRLGNYRFRIGDYRVIFDKKAQNSILVLAVGHRKQIYRRS